MIAIRSNKCGTERVTRGTVRSRFRASGVRRVGNSGGTCGARNRFHFPIGFRTDAIRQDFPSVRADAFHSLSVSASSRGLVAPAYGQSSSKGKSENVRKDGEKIHV